MKTHKSSHSNVEYTDLDSQTTYPIFYAYMDSLIGPILVASQDHLLIRICFGIRKNSDLLSQLKKEYNTETFIESKKKNQRALKQLLEYFQGTRFRFSVHYRLRGTDFQKAVWDAVAKVPYGQTVFYGEIARRIGNPKASRAVGGANRANPIPIIIPCHRIIGADGTMTGYGGKSGIPLKIKLLDLEKKNRKIK